MRATGALRSFLVPSGFFGNVLSGDDDDGVRGVTDGRVLSLIGTKALRTSSAADSLPLSLGLLGGVLDGLFGSISVVVFGGICDGYSYLIGSTNG